MIRGLLVLAVVAVVAVTAFVLGGEPGRASVEWLGWRIDMTAAAAALAIIVGAFLAVAIWRIALWIVATPRRQAAARAEARRQRGLEALGRGFLAAAAGDGSEARRLAQQAGELVEDAPALVRILAAQAAEAAGDAAAAQAAYAAMLGFPEMRLAGHRGLMQGAIAQGEHEAALRHAKAAYGLARTSRWAWRALLESRLEGGDWAAALELVQSALERKIVSPISAERARAALLAASAASLETSPNPALRVQALEFAAQSAKLDLGFPPGPVIAARLLIADGKPPRAAALIEQAWRARPHPALYLLWRDLKSAETPKARAARLGELAALNPANRESRFVAAEQALLLRDPDAARAAVAAMDQTQPDARLCGLMARIANAAGHADEARAWMARGLNAAQEPDWTDLDPQGRAFAYAPTDWARLVSTYAESGELIHPRLERRERVMSELPELPAAYEPGAPYPSPEAIVAPYDPGPEDDWARAETSAP
ncbi:MAG TPA: heme biosynthesis HemY N-terminal domain-containing protein [Caulobacteraceae bacterium]|jgi:HemY protein|nr:heme biosynthesis HemY N-terminal domain-containing protein [Caulobacteraceae bacterium]